MAYERCATVDLASNNITLLAERAARASLRARRSIMRDLESPMTCSEPRADSCARAVAQGVSPPRATRQWQTGRDAHLRNHGDTRRNYPQNGAKHVKRGKNANQQNQWP